MPFGKSNSEGWCRNEAVVSGKDAALYATEPGTGHTQHFVKVEGIFELS